MKAFAAGELHLLVSTTVVEVGVDVPNASVMVVEHAERFGLSQLHQLRGRVGPRSASIVLFSDCISRRCPRRRAERLKAMTETTDGFEIAERDLGLRGAGDFFGTRQAGMPTFRLVDLVRDRSCSSEHSRKLRAGFVGGSGQRDGRPAARAWEERFRLVEIG